MTFPELLVAIAVASVFLLGIVSAVSGVLHASQTAALRGEATSNARNALQQMSLDIAEANALQGGNVILRLVGTDAPQLTGDLRDNDYDGRIDEEAHDGQDDDNDGSVATVSHALLENGASPGLDVYERPRQRTLLEVGDPQVDEDVVFQADTLTFIKRLNRITYSIGTFDGEDNVLLRRSVPLITTLPVPPTEEQPIAFGVLSLNFLYFDPNWIVGGEPQPWRTEWDSVLNTGPIYFPATIHASVTVYSGDVPFADLNAGQAIDTVSLETQVAIETVLPLYRATF